MQQREPLLRHMQRAWSLGCGSDPSLSREFSQEWARTQDDSLTRSPCKGPYDDTASERGLAKQSTGTETCAMRSDLCCRTDCCKRKDHTMPYRCASLPQEQPSSTRVRTSHGGRGGEDQHRHHRHSRQTWAAALQQLLIHVSECPRVAQGQRGVEAPRAEIQTSGHSPGTASRRSSTTRQSGRKDTRRRPHPTRFTAKSFRKIDADRIQHASTRKGTGTPRNMQEDKKKCEHREGLCDRQKPHRTSERSDPAPSFVEASIRQNRRRLAQEGRTYSTDQIEYLESIKKDQTISRSAEIHVEESHASVRRAGVKSQVWKQPPEPRARSATHLAMPRRQRGGVRFAANHGTPSTRDHTVTHLKVKYNCLRECNAKDTASCPLASHSLNSDPRTVYSTSFFFNADVVRR